MVFILLFLFLFLRGNLSRRTAAPVILVYQMLLPELRFFDLGNLQFILEKLKFTCKSTTFCVVNCFDWKAANYRLDTLQV